MFFVTVFVEQFLVNLLFSMKPFHSAAACRWDRGLVVLAYQSAAIYNYYQISDQKGSLTD
jgi:hypothetical protein